MAGVAFTAHAAPPFEPGTVLSAWARYLFPGPPPSAGVTPPPGVPAVSTALVEPAGTATFSGLRPERTYYYGGEVDGVWRWRWFTSPSAASEAAERARAEARERELEGELSEINVVGVPGGSVMAWGEGAGGDPLGLGVEFISAVYKLPVAVPGLSGVVKLSGGQSFMLALKSDGTVWHAGGSTFGQAGDGTNLDKLTFHQVALPEAAVDADAHSFPMALLPSGRVLAWGGNSGQLGIGSETARWEPTYVEGSEGVILEGVKAIGAGHISGWFVMEDGTLRRTGIADDQVQQYFAEVVPGISSVKKVVGSKEFCVCLLTDGTVRVKGRNNNGALGNGVFDATKNATNTWSNPGLSAVKQVALSEYHVVVLMNDGTVRTWGRNHRGQCGNGHWDQEVPLSTVTIGSLGGNAYKVGWTLLAGQTAYEVQWRTAGTTKWVVANSSPELSGSTHEYTITGWVGAAPEVRVLGTAALNVPFDPGLTGVVEVFAGGGEESGGVVGDWFTLCRMSDGTFKGFGGSSDGELARGDRLTQLSPVACVAGVSDALGVGGAESHVGVIRPVAPPAATAIALKAIPVPGTSHVLVEWTPPEGDRVKEWKVQWCRVENNPSTGKAEAFKSTTASLKLPGSTTSYTIEGLPLPEQWSNAANTLEVKVTAVYPPVTQGPTITSLGNGRWKISWLATEGPSAYDFATKTTHQSPEPGWNIFLRTSPGEPLKTPAHKLEEVPGGTTEIVVEGYPGPTLEGSVEGSGGTLFQVQTVTVLPLEMPPEVPYMVKVCKVAVAPVPGVAAALSILRKPRVNVVVQQTPAPSSGTELGHPKVSRTASAVKGVNAGEWIISWFDPPNGKGEHEPGWLVRWRTSTTNAESPTTWVEATVSAVQAAGAGSLVLTGVSGTVKNIEARVEGTRAAVGDVLSVDPGVWLNTPTSRTYQWYRLFDKEGIGQELLVGETGPTYTVKPHDLGGALRVAEVPSNAVGAANTGASGVGTRFISGPSMPVVVGF